MTTEVDTNLIIENLTELLQNTVNMTSVFYDIFLNPEPMDVTLTQYNADGQLISIDIPNRAKDMQRAKLGTGSPEGVVTANEGTLYIDQVSQAVYIKGTGTGNTGWKIILTEEGVYTYVKKYLVDNGYLTEESLIDYLVAHNYTTENDVADIIASSKQVTYLETLASNGTILLSDNTSYKITPTGSVAFILPTITDLTKLHRIFVQVNLTNVNYLISVGTSYFFNGINPDFSEVGMYDIQYEYDNATGVWVCQTAIKEAGQFISIPALYKKVNSAVAIDVDDFLSLDSENPVQNKVITEALNDRGTLVTSISASSTDTEYPSAKCVYDLIGDIEAVLDHIIAG